MWYSGLPVHCPLTVAGLLWVPQPAGSRTLPFALPDAGIARATQLGCVPTLRKDSFLRAAVLVLSVRPSLPYAWEFAFGANIHYHSRSLVGGGSLFPVVLGAPDTQDLSLLALLVPFRRCVKYGLP